MTRELTRTEVHSVVAASPASSGSLPLGRRRFLKLSFWMSLGALALGAGAGAVNSLYPRGIKGFGGPVVVKAADIPVAGAAPKPNIEGHFLLVNLAPEEGRLAGDASESDGGLLALWWKCPHLGCTVPWKGDFSVSQDKDPLERRGWFNCNCHGSTYTKAGVRVYGPAPRSMDTMELAVNKDGSVTVQTSKVRSGTIDNPRRAVPRTPPM